VLPPLIIPELDVWGVQVYKCPLAPVPSPALTVGVGCVSGIVSEDREGYSCHLKWPVELDHAHRLSWYLPEAYIWPESCWRVSFPLGGRSYLRVQWSVTVLAFTLHEALEPYHDISRELKEKACLQYL
jgi:hypothetical protein